MSIYEWWFYIVFVRVDKPCISCSPRAFHTNETVYFCSEKICLQRYIVIHFINGSVALLYVVRFPRTLRSYNTVYCTLKSIKKTRTLRHHVYCENEGTIIFYHNSRFFLNKFYSLRKTNCLTFVDRPGEFSVGKVNFTLRWDRGEILSTIPYTMRQLIDGLSDLCSVCSDFIRR